MCTKYPMQGNFFLGRPEKVMDSDFFKKIFCCFWAKSAKNEVFQVL